MVGYDHCRLPRLGRRSMSTANDYRDALNELLFTNNEDAFLKVCGLIEAECDDCGFPFDAHPRLSNAKDGYTIFCVDKSILEQM